MKQMVIEQIQKAAKVDWYNKAAVAVSGGIDSATVLMAVRWMFMATKAFIMKFGTKGDDVEGAVRVANYLDVDFEIVEFGNLWENLVKVNRYLEKPQYNVWLYALAQKAAEQGYECLFTGEGADEIYGYPDRDYFRGWASQLDWINPAWEASCKLAGITYFAPYLRAARLCAPEHLIQFYHPPDKVLLRHAYRNELPDWILRKPATPPGYVHFGEILVNHNLLMHVADDKVIQRRWMRYFANKAWNEAWDGRVK